MVKPTSTTEYAYDSSDRRTVVIEDGVMTRTLWSGADEVGEYDAAGALRRRFIPDGSGAMDARLAMVAADGTVSWFHTNHQGSVIAMSNGSGAAIAVANYSEYGKFGTDASGNPLTAPPGGSQFGYTGRQWDAKAGLYNYRARYYDPALGVFLSMDPIGSKDDPNLFMYVGNDPVNLTDPTGMCVGVLPCPVPAPAVTLPTAAEVGGAIVTVARATPVAAFLTVVFTPTPVADATCSGNPGVCGPTVHNNDADAPPEQAGDGNRTPAPALAGDPYNPAEVDRRRSGRRNDMGAPSNDPDSPIPDQGPREDVGGHTARGRTPHVTGERNVNPNEEHSRRPKGNPTGRPR